MEHNPTATRFQTLGDPTRGDSFRFPAALKINIKRLDHVQLCVPRDGEERAREFYAGLLGLKEIDKPEVLRANGGMWFEIADVQLHIGVEDAAAKSKRHPAFEVEGVEEIRKFLERNGVRTRDEKEIAGVRRFSFFDPFDNRIELMERVGDGGQRTTDN